MKKLLAVLMALVLLCGTALPAFADGYVSLKMAIPVIMLSGDGEPLVDADGNQVFDINHLDKLADGTNTNQLVESVANVLQPFLLEGVLFDRWDKYYANLEKEIGELTEDVRLDENGNSSNGTGISATDDHISDTRDAAGERREANAASRRERECFWSCS